MAKQLQKLELTWIGKGNEPKLEPRILIEDPSKSFGDPKSENMLIHGDNLLALKALEQNFENKIKCIYIDPPYNTGNAFERYDDGVEHSLWLSLMKPRMELLKSLLREDGSIWISIDDNECHYLKVMCDEVFGRNNFVSNIVYRRRKTQANLTKYIATVHDHILVYAKNKDKFIVNRVPYSEEYIKKTFKNPDNDLRGPYQTGPLARPDNSNNKAYELTMPNGRKITAKWSCSQDTFNRYVAENLLVIPRDGEGMPRIKMFLKDYEGTIPNTWFEDVGTNDDSSKEIENLFGSNKEFAYAKPEKLIKYIFSIGSKEGDNVLDSFLGSGTTAAVAHKMNRRWIGIELGEHARTHCLPRLQHVISGKDKGGITEALNWKGGGGFKFYTLAPSLVQKDKYGTEIINPQYNANMLAAAMAKQEGFRYQPDENNYWKQGMSSEKDFIFTTTQFVTVAMLDKLTEELKPGESLLVCCKSFAKGCANRHTNITIKKIPQMLLGRCEFGKDDYSFNIVNLPHNDDTDIEIEDSEESEAPKTEKKTKAKKQKDDDTQSSLF
jgi:adenine-specific DNA-methyltransferase